MAAGLSAFPLKDWAPSRQCSCHRQGSCHLKSVAHVKAEVVILSEILNDLLFGTCLTYSVLHRVDLPAVSIQTRPAHLRSPLCRTGPRFLRQKMRWERERCHSGQGSRADNLPSGLHAPLPGGGPVSSQPAMAESHQRLCNNEENMLSDLVVRALAFNDKIITKTWVCCLRPVDRERLSTAVSLKRSYCSPREGALSRAAITAQRSRLMAVCTYRPEQESMAAPAYASQDCPGHLRLPWK